MKNNQAIGIAILVIGIVVLASGLILWVANPGQTTTNLLQTTQYTVHKGDEISVGIPLSSGDVIQGTFNQINGSTVNFYFMNSTQQNAFGNCAPCSSPAILNASNPATYTYSEKVGTTGTYYLIFDNSNGNKAVIVSASATLANGANSNQTIFYALIGLGVFLAIVGAAMFLMRPGGKAKPDESKRTPPSSSVSRPSDLKQSSTS